ncbi:hypothetical protein CAPTEDRAFT_202978 [Capitella teleta]|uniref:Uncharacterized protein n=1 Tax=Capitella teleta TaxID=283909 RepID=R7TUE7_CAPTE|nr:hypothetical protein CAPTEDRAFT_202978 [Capitella teleta]|eukprot:ELT95091.1 hypothetical protein CAPTEDRAFT_202978 [Capitella teleta]
MKCAQGFRFINKVAMVTSSSKGIGLATARRLARKGAKVILSSRNEANVNRAVSQLKNEGLGSVYGMVCHVGNPDQVDYLFHEVSERRPNRYLTRFVLAISLKTHLDLNLQIIEINLKAPFRVIQAAFPLMKERPNSSIVLMGTYGSLDPQVCLSDPSIIFHSHKNKYSSTGGRFWDRLILHQQGALMAMTEAMAPHLAENSIRINCVAPGSIDTDFFNGVRSKVKPELSEGKGFHDEIIAITLIPELNVDTYMAVIDRSRKPTPDYL